MITLARVLALCCVVLLVAAGISGFNMQSPISSHSPTTGKILQQKPSSSTRTMVLYAATNDNEMKQLRVIDLPTELAAFEYVEAYDYASYDIFEDADR